jgi:transposase
MKRVIDAKRAAGAVLGLVCVAPLLILAYLPPYSPELNRIEILWKHAKYLWRRFVAVNGADLLNEIQSLMKGFGNEFTINFA